MISEIIKAGGVAGILVVLILRELLPYLKTKNGNGNGNGNGGSGQKSVEFWRAEIFASVASGFSSVVAPILANQSRILEEIRDSNQKNNDNLIRAVLLLERGDRNR